MHHGNWLLNRLLFEIIIVGIPILSWKSNTVISFNRIPVFEDCLFGLISNPSTVPNQNLTARSVHSHFVGVESDERLCRVMEPNRKLTLIFHLRDFLPYRSEQLPSEKSIQDGLSRRIEQSEGKFGTNDEDSIKDVLKKQ